MNLGVTGHQDLPDEAMAYIQAGLKSLIDHIGSNITCVSSLAAGADQLVAMSVLRGGGKLKVVIPCAGYDRTFIDKRDLETFSNLLKNADHVETLNYDDPSEEAFLNAGKTVVQYSERLVAVWDGQPAKGSGGTADIVRFAVETGIQVDVIWPKGVKR